MWDLVLPALERHHDVLAPTLAGHTGGPLVGEDVSDSALVDALEAAMDAAGFATAHVVGNSLGGYLAFKLAERGRARSVVALAPAGGWEPADPARAEVFAFFDSARLALQAIAPQAEAFLATRAGRRAATQSMVTHFDHIPVSLLAHLVRGSATCPAGRELNAHGAAAEWGVEPEHVTCPVRIVWGTADALLPWPSAAARYREWFPWGDWVELEGVGHCPQLDVPLETAQVVLGFTR